MKYLFQGWVLLVLALGFWQEVCGVRSLLLYNAIATEDISAIKWLLEEASKTGGPDEVCLLVNTEQEGIAPLCKAITTGHVTIAQLLLHGGANACAKDQDEMTPLHQVAASTINQRDGIKIAELLQEYGAVFSAKNKNRQTPLHLAAMHGNAEMPHFLLERLTDKGMVNGQDKDGKIPLHISAAGGKLEVVCLLVKYGAEKKGRVSNLRLRMARKLWRK